MASAMAAMQATRPANSKAFGSGFLHSHAAPGGRAGLLQFGALGGEADFGKAQEDQAEDRAGVFLRLEAGVGAELVGGIPEALFLMALLRAEWEELCRE
jgi:hypothetical protein